MIARTTLKDTAGTTMGTAEFTQSFGGLVTVAVTLDGAPPGGHALHLHAVGACDPEGDAPFASAGDHFNPAGAAHPEHAGDLGNMGTDTAGHGEFWTVADRFTLSPSHPPCWTATAARSSSPPGWTTRHRPRTETAGHGSPEAS